MTEPHTGPSSPGATAPALSVGTLFYLWGDRVVPAAGRLGGTVLPSGVKVAAKELSAVVFAASFWHLRQGGALQLQETTKKALGLIKQHHVGVAMGAHLDFRTGYEDAIMRRVAGGATTAYDVVHSWLGRDVSDPEGVVFGLATRELIDTGLAREVDSGRSRIGGALLGRSKVEHDPARISQTWPAFERAHQGWMHFTQTEPTLAGTLVETCTKAIRNRQESSD